MTGRFPIFILLALGAVGSTQAAETPPTITLCASCHGSQGEGNQALRAPRLAGQDAAYLARQLANFKSGKRAYDPEDKAGATMRAAAAGLNEADMQSMAKFYSQLAIAAPASQAAPKVDLSAGKELYLGTCAACHGAQAQGYPQLQVPSLRALGGWYITGQIEAFVKGWRGDGERSDQPAIWMRSIASHINQQQELTDVVQYIGGLPAPAAR